MRTDQIDPALLPPLARARARVLRERTGREPEVTRVDTGYRVRLANERVELTMTWRRGSRRARTWSYSSTLCIDGRQVGLVRGMTDFLAVFADPDSYVPPVAGGRATSTKTLSKKPLSLPEMGEPLETVPAAVQQTYRAHIGGPEREGENRRLGYRDGEWQILLTFTFEGKQVHVYLGFVAKSDGQYKGSPEYFIVGVDGYDVTHMLDNEQLGAMGLLGIVSPRADPERTPPGRPRHERRYAAIPSSATKDRETTR